MRPWVLLSLCAFVGCEFNPTKPPPPRTVIENGASPFDESRPTWRGQRHGPTARRSPMPPLISPDGESMPEESDIPHLDQDDIVFGTDDFFPSTATIDTTDLSIRGTLVPAGLVFEAVAQRGGGPELAVLRTKEFSVFHTGHVRVVGHRPLVILAAGAVTIAGKLDVSADHETPGAGGIETLGEGGNASGSTEDPGGGGGGFAHPGADGGGANGELGGIGGAHYGDDRLTTLTGGSAGGYGSPGRCPAASGGAGGGAIQIVSLVRIEVTILGSIHAGGGGGRGGELCRNGDAGGGGGGGSGGAIDLMAPTVTNSGEVVANGGAGGGAGSGGVSSIVRGSGGDGANASIANAAGGNGGGPYGSAGGEGGWSHGAAEPGTSLSGRGNAGGGGGSVGRIVIRTRDVPFANRARMSPEAVGLMY